MEFSVKDSLRFAVEEASGGRNTIMYDDRGNMNVMVRFDKFDMSEWGRPNLSGTFPAFIVHGKEVPEIWISKYRNSNLNGCPVSMPGMPMIEGHYADHLKMIEQKGKGWHMMTWLERAAMVHESSRIGYDPDGPSGNGGVSRIDKFTTYEKDERGRALTGGHPNSWTHNRMTFGVCDVVGYQTWEAVHGYKLIGNDIYITGKYDDKGGVIIENNFDFEYVKDAPGGQVKYPSKSASLQSGNVSEFFNNDAQWGIPLNYCAGLCTTSNLSGLMWSSFDGEHILMVGGKAQGLGDGIKSFDLDWGPTFNTNFRTCYISPEYL